MESPIEVGVVFRQSVAQPLWFQWGRRRYDVRGVKHAWRGHAGGGAAHHYAVTHGDKVYELRLDAETLRWSLGRIWHRS